jgi:tetratricopeptide (TPR) repeat protein
MGVIMHKYKILLVALFLVGMAVTGFECSSTEITSAKLYIQQKNYDKALEALKKEVAKNPKSDEGYYLMGEVYGELNNYDSLAIAFDSSLAISNQFQSKINDSRRYYWAHLFNSGVNYYQEGIKASNKDSSTAAFDKSIHDFKEAAMLEPDSADTYKNLAFVYMNETKYDDAIAPLKKLIDKEHSLDGYKYLGDIYYDEAAKARGKYESSKNVQDSLAYMQDYDKAIEVLQEGRKYFPHNSDLLLTLSNSYIGANKIEVAMKAFKAGVEEEPGNKYYHYNYGVLLLDSKNYSAAMEQFQDAVNIDSAYSNALYNLAVTYVRLGTAISDSINSATVNVNNPNAVQDTSYKAKYRMALPYLERVVKVKPDDASAWELLGKVYTVLNESDKAKKAFDMSDQLRK